jgi:hypothetical protein
MQKWEHGKILIRQNRPHSHFRNSVTGEDVGGYNVLPGNSFIRPARPVALVPAEAEAAVPGTRPSHRSPTRPDTFASAAEAVVEEAEAAAAAPALRNCTSG